MSRRRGLYPGTAAAVRDLREVGLPRRARNCVGPGDHRVHRRLPVDLDKPAVGRKAIRLDQRRLNLRYRASRDGFAVGAQHDERSVAVFPDGVDLLHVPSPLPSGESRGDEVMARHDAM